METFFKTVQEWLDSDPDQETISRVLNTVNRGVVSQMRRNLNQKKSELKKVERIVESMEKINFPVTKEVKDRVAALKKEIAKIEKRLPDQKK
ncbi:MAG: hypothetical protein KAR19_00720 [Bacteroidales bacterium]|nr:hypothetical protein [Bacteroidales bacterium]